MCMFLIVGEMAGLIGTKLSIHIHLGPATVSSRSRSECGGVGMEATQVPRVTEAGRMP